MREKYYKIKEMYSSLRRMSAFVLMCAIMLFSSVAINAQNTTVTIGTGTTTASHPLPGLWGYQYDVYLYDASEVTADGYIKKLAYNVSSATSNSSNSKMQIYMKDVDPSYTLNANTTFATYISGATLVYTNNSYATPSTGWQHLTLSNNFCHEAGKSLLIAVRTEGCTTSGGCSKSVYSTAVTNKVWYKHADSSDPGTAVAGTVTNARANIILTFNGNCCTATTGNFSLSAASGRVIIGQTLNLAGMITNTVSQAGTISYSSSNTSVATVSNSGVITGVAEGSATITIMYTPNNSTYCKRTLTFTINVSTDDCAVIGTGETCNYTNAPVNDYYKYGYRQIIYPAASLSPGMIMSISFYYCYSTAMTKKTNVNIYLGHTANATFATTSSWVPLSGLTLVYSGPLNCSQGWNRVTLPTPFSYDGTNNLVLAIDDNSGQYDGSSYTFRTTEGTGNVMLYQHSDSENVDPASPPAGTLSSTFPNTKFCIEDCTLLTGNLSFNTTEDEILIGQTINLSGYLNNTITQSGNISYSSYNTGVATVSSSGVVTGVAEGTTTIVATFTPASSNYCIKTAEFTVNVTDGCPIIGTGASCSYLYGPVNNNYDYGYYQFIYPMDGLSNGGDIASIAFKYCYTTAMTKKTSVRIYMGLTTRTAFSSTTDWVPLSQLTLVYSGALNCSQGWNTINLTNSFSYDGTSNLVIAIDDNSGDYDGTSYTFEYTTATANSVLYKYQDDSDINPSSPPEGIRASNRPNIKICFDECTERTFAFANPTVTVNGGATTTQVPVATPSGGTITYTSSNTSVATVSSTGVVTTVGAGTAVITAVISPYNGYCSARASYNLVVNGTTHTLTYNTTANCTGSASAAPPSVSGTSATVTSTVPTCSTLPYFVGWNTMPNGSGTSYTAGSTVNLGAQNVTLYAQYSSTAPQITGSADCETAMAFCASNDNTGYNLTVEPGDDTYPTGMCSYYRNATWWYLRISQEGPIEMTIESTCGDVDFGCWGPFENTTCDQSVDLTDDGANGYDYFSGASNAALHSSNTTTAPSHSTTTTAICTTGALASPCGNLVDFGGSTSDVEYLQIPNAHVGEIYVVVIGNYANCTGNITFTQTNLNASVHGESDCTIVNDCSISSITTNVGECNASQTFSVSGNINFSDAPLDGTLEVTDGNVTATYYPPFVSPLSYTLENLPGATDEEIAGMANGTIQGRTITATFTSSSVNCSRTTYINPPECVINCPDATVTLSGYDEVIGGIYYYDVCLNSGVNMSATQTGYTTPAPSWTWSVNPHHGIAPTTLTGQSVSYTPNAEQGYDVSLTVASGECRTVAHARIRVSGGPQTTASSFDLGSICVGDSETITIGGTGSAIVVTDTTFDIQSTLGQAGETFIPDGPNCTDQCYTSSVTFYDYEDGATVSGVNDIQYLRLNMEHSFIGDVQIKLTCPSGRSSIILPDFYSTDTAAHNVYNSQAIDPYTYQWPSMAVDTVWRVGSSATTYYYGYYMFGRSYPYNQNTAYTFTVNGTSYNGYLVSFTTAEEAWDFIDNYLLLYYTARTYSVVYYAAGGYYAISYTSDSNTYYVYMSRNTSTDPDDAYAFPTQQAAQHFLTNVYGGSGVVSYTLESSRYNRIYFGEPDIYDVVDGANLTGTQICDEDNEHNLAGRGYDYAWTSNQNYNTVGYVYNLANLSANTTVYNNGTQNTNTLYHVIPSDVNAGTQIYQPFQSFSNLIGCPLNGTWTISVCDSWAKDNGYIFNWELALDPALLPNDWDYTVGLETVTVDCGSMVSVSGNDVVVTPQSGSSMPNNCNITLRDHYGCTTIVPLTFTVTEPTITLNAGSNNDQEVCEDMAIDDIVYTIGGSAVSATVTGLPSGVALVVEGTTATITGMPSEPGTYNYTITTNSGTGSNCTEHSLTGRLIVNVGNIVPEFDQAGPYCEGTTVNDLPTTSNNGITGRWTPAITNSTNRYTFTPDAGQCATITTMDITVNPLPTLEYTSGSETLCANIAPTENIVFTFGGGANGADVTGLPAGMEFNIVGSTIVISGTPTVSGSFPYVVTTTGAVDPCVNEVVTRTITVNESPTLVLTSGSNSQTVCSGSAITPLVYTYGAGATGANATMPAGLTQQLNTTAHTLTISGIPTASGTITVVTTGVNDPCEDKTLTATITVNELPTLQLVSASADVDLCRDVPWADNIQYSFGGSATGVTVTGLPAGVTYSVAGSTVTISGNPTDEAGTYSYTITTVGAVSPCENISLTGNIRVSENATLVLASAVGTDEQSICLPGDFEDIVYTFGGGATGVDLAALNATLPNGVVASVNTITQTVLISGTPTETGTFEYSVTTTGSVDPCKSETVSGTIIINRMPELIVSGNDNQSFCLGNAMTDLVFTYGGGATGAVTAGTLPAGVTTSNGTNTLTLSGTPTAFGNYSFSVVTTGAAGTCTNVELPVSINVFNNPTVGITPSETQICNGSTATLTSNPATFESYAWTCVTSSNATYTITSGMPASTTGSSIVVNPTVTPGNTDITYSLSVTDANGCTASVEQAITVSDIPEAEVTVSPNTRCEMPYNGSITVGNFSGALAGGTYVVKVNGESLTSTGANVVFNGLNPGNYVVRVSSGSTSDDCYSEYTVTIGDEPTHPTVAISGQLSICDNTSTTLVAHADDGYGTFTYSWSDNTTGETLVTPNLTETTVYYVLATDENDCTAYTEATVSIGDTPDVSVTAVTPICLGKNTVLQAMVSNAGSDYTLQWSATPSANSGLLTTTGDRITVTPAEAGSYSYTVQLTTRSCSSGSDYIVDADPFVVVVNPLPEPNIVNNTGTDVLTCDVTTISLTATNGTSYVWSNGINDANNTINSVGNYVVTVTDANTCSATTSIAITNDIATPQVAITEPASRVLTCANNESIVLEATTSTLGATLDWTTLTVTTPGMYTVQATGLNGCTSTASIEITRDVSTPNVGINNPATTVLTCATPEITLTAYGSGTLSWTTQTVDQEGTYEVVATAANGCVSTANIYIGIDKADPNINIVSSGDILSCRVQAVSLTASGARTYRWNDANSSAGASLSVTMAGTYTVTGTAANGCTAEASYTINPDYDAPNAWIEAPTTVLNCNDLAITLTARATPAGSTFSWTTRRVSTPGTYSVVATAPNGCVDTAYIDIAQDVTLPDVNITAPDTILTCTTDRITLTASGTGTLDWTTMDVTIPGRYELIAVGDNGCSNSTQITIGQNIATPNVSLLNNTGTDVLNCNVRSISVSVEDDSDADVYVWSAGGENTTGTGNAFTSPGTYSVVATAPNGCTSVASIQIGQDIVPPTVDITNNSGTTVLTCDMNQISVTAVGSATVESYLWSQGTTQTTADNTLVTTGTYVVTATASNGCTATANIDITESVNRPDITFTNLSGTTVLTCDVTSIEVTATGTGASYQWSGGATPGGAHNTFNTIGTYYVTATGTNGCTNTRPFSITENIVPPTVSITNESGYNEINCNYTLVNVTATGSGVSYSWSNGIDTPENTFITPGTYTVTSTAANGCTSTANVVITEDHNPPTPSVLSTNGLYIIDCAHPSLILNATGGASYLWNPGGQTTSQITVSSPGTYTVQATGTNGCTATVSVEIGINTEAPAVAINNITGEEQLNCNVQTIHVIAQGGYLYAWNNLIWGGGPEQNITQPGVYAVTVTARNGCTNSAAITITEDTEPPTLQANSTTGFYELNCDVPQIIVEATGNGISYAWSGGTNPTGSTNAFTSAGIYTVTSTGFNGCTSSVSVQQITTNYTQPTVSIVNQLGSPVQIVTLNCTNPEATLSVQGTGISYTWNDNETSSLRTFDHQGLYSVVARGSNGCTAAASVEIREDFTPPAAQIVNSTNATELTCLISSISLTANGGTGATYAWSNGTNNRTVVVTTPDTYTVTVTGTNGCTNTNSVNITQAPVFEASIINVGTINCNGGSTSATVTATGGNPGYYYTWSDGQTLATANNLVAGSYTVTVRDNGGCSAVLSCNIMQPQPLVVGLNPHDLYCGVSLGSVDAAVTGGTPNYTYMWSTGSTGTSLSNLNVGTYNLTVTDSKSCIATASTTIRMLGMLSVNASVVQPISCNGANDGIMNVTCENGASPYMYSWSTGHSISMVNNMFAGSYQVTVTDAWGCSGQSSVTLVAPSAMVVDLTPISPKCYNTRDGHVTVLATGGVSPYSYAWNNGAISQNLDNVAAGTYSLTITDAAGCSTSRNVSIDAPEAVNMEIAATDVKCYGERNGKIEIAANGGTEPYRYSVERVLELSTSSMFTNIGAGYYNARVTDANGCEAVKSVVIRQPEEIKIDVVSENPFCKNSRTGMINISAIGGITPYQYYWDNYMSDTAIMQNIPEGQYIVGVVDANGCKSLTEKVTLVDVDVDCLRIPNVFTPNGDGINDEWIIANLGMFPEAQIYVFNRWGQLMFKTTGDGEPWDGSYRGHYVPAGTYIYVIDLFNDDEPYKGTVTIVY
ncbi:MAG: gliding motility-associated C-terminal domain-containing protein [Bacteroidales bacterium]|nr:gliding motility-associated C-terminal domain-containing protein [Bacteroidales bacterium]